MSDDKFTLGNFSGIAEDDGLDKDMSQEVEADLERLDEKVKAEGVVPHPTVKSDPQAKFRYRDGRPLLDLGLDQIVPNEFQPRRIFDAEKLQELADSIKEHGIIQPIVVNERPDGKYEIIVGERRLRASKLAGLAKIPAFVSPKLSDEAKLEVALIENIQRAELNPIEEAKAYQRLQEEFKLSVKDIAKRVGKNYSTISNLIRLLGLPAEIQRALIEGKIPEGQARPLLSLRDQNEMLEMFYIMNKRQMNTREIEAKVREIKERKIKVKEMFTPDPFLESLENMLRNKLGTRVILNKSAKGGKITIEFFSDEELNNIVSKIS